MLLKADKLHVPEKGAGALSDALAEKFRIRNEKEVLGMAALATDIGLNDGEALCELRLETQKPREADSRIPRVTSLARVPVYVSFLRMMWTPFLVQSLPVGLAMPSSLRVRVMSRIPLPASARPKMRSTTAEVDASGSRWAASWPRPAPRACGSHMARGWRPRSRGKQPPAYL